MIQFERGRILTTTATNSRHKHNNHNHVLFKKFDQIRYSNNRYKNKKMNADIHIYDTFDKINVSRGRKGFDKQRFSVESPRKTSNSSMEELLLDPVY